MTQWIDHPLAQALASALLHFLWQGALLALLAAVCWRVVRPSAAHRYLIGIIALAAMLAAPLLTLSYLASRSPGDPPRSMAAPVEISSPLASAASSAPSSAAPVAPPGGWDGIAVRLAPARPLILPLWLAGVLVLSGRLMGGWLVARRLSRQAVGPVTSEIAFVAARLAERLAITRAVRIVESSAAAMPLMVGWLKPVILLPTAVLTTLAPAQLEALLAHELAHIRRHDYLVNLLQSVVETLLFYHPAVWWLSQQVRAQREHCCDDLAVTVCDRVTYVTALADLAALGTGARVALAATDGSLLGRVRRLLGHTQADAPAVGPWVLALLLAIAATAVFPAAIASPLEQNHVVTGVEGGVPGGVEQGVPGGVPAGVQGGIQGGVPGGVPGGIPGDARIVSPDGAGDAGNHGRAAQPPTTRREAVPPQPPASAAEGRRAELLKLLEREHASAEEYLMQQGEVEQQRLALELKTLEAQLEASRREQEIEIVNLKRELQRVQNQTDVGLAEPAERERLRNALALAELRAKMAEAERASRMQQAALELEAARRKFAFQKQQLEIERARRRIELEGGRDDERAVREPELARTVVADQSQPIEPGDVLGVEIAGEPSLPRLYRVAADGAITLPLLGRVPAGGRTAEQVRDEIRRLLAGRGLKQNAAVAVTRRQPQ